MRWLVGVTPVSTYQWMTTVARPETYVQHVDAPAAFSAATWGYQLSGGVAWRQAVYQLSVGYIRRWAYYDLATSTFQVRSVGLNQYEVTPLKQAVVENEALFMLGASARKHWVLGGPSSPYFARLGGAFTYVPNTRQSLVWANASAGVSIPLTKAYQLQVGPSVEYGVSRLWSSQRQLIIHPYLVGATLSLQANNP
ncbi:hypothetical protein GCM10028819_24650 [Spirosoma humi]